LSVIGSPTQAYTHSTVAPQPYSRTIPLSAIILLAFAVHVPLLLMELPNGSYDAYFHMFFASHYAHHWFNPWNEKWFTGFSQTTYPPLQHYWMALLAKIGFSMPMAYAFVQGVAILLLPVGMFRFARLFVSERAASYAAVGSVLLGSLSFLVYQSGQLSTTMAAPLYLNALPYFYDWSREGKWRALVKGIVLCLAAAAAHHVTLLFGAVLFAFPVLWLAVLDRDKEGLGASAGGVIGRAVAFGIVTGVGIAVVLLPYFLALIQNPIKQMPIPHASRDNFLLHPIWGINFWVIPFGTLILALPYIFWKGTTERRLRPLFFGFWMAFLFGLGGTTPVPRWLLGRAFYVLTFERFNFWASLLALPIAALLAIKIVDRFQRTGAIAVFVAACISCGAAMGWLTWHPYNIGNLDVQPVVNFLNHDNHNKFRYLTLGFGSLMSKVGMEADASSVDGEYNSARLLPEMTRYGSAQLSNSKYYGANGMASLRAILKHANHYGLKYIFVRDRYYEPLLAFAGWRPVEQYDNGLITLWSKDDVPPARPMDFGGKPPAWQGIMWGILPIGSSILAIIAVLLLPDKRRPVATPIEFPSGNDDLYVREAK
jgi:hypothetical protein